MSEPRSTLRRQRWRLLAQVNALAERPLIVLSLVWLVLLVLDLTRGLGRSLQILNYTIWALFVLDFVIELTIAPDKLGYVRRNWLAVLSLALPAVRAFRALRAFRSLRLLRAARSGRTWSLVRLLASFNRGMRSTRSALGRRRVGYVLALTTLITLLGAAGMAHFESAAALRDAEFADAADVRANGLSSYGEALWWTTMIMTTMGSAYWPRTIEGRVLCVMLALYSFAVFGYITATIASFFLGQDAAAQTRGTRNPPSDETIDSLRRDIAALRQELAARDVAKQNDAPTPSPPE